jgi:hypothetical protein
MDIELSHDKHNDDTYYHRQSLALDYLLVATAGTEEDK